MTPMENIDAERLAHAWDFKEDYDGCDEQPWDDTRYPRATNDVGAGWAILIDRAVLVEHFDGQRTSHVYENVALAEAAWPSFTLLYDDHADTPERPTARWANVA